MARLCLILAVLTSFVVSVTPAGAQPRPHGQSYSEWAADWWTWALSQPAATNPVLDPTGEQCAVGQQGGVWFLAGTFDTGPVVRDCTVPAGTALLMPVINEFYCAQVTDPAEQRTETYARAQVADVQTGATDLSVTIDGKPVQHLHYEESVLFSVVLPAGNIFGLPAGELLDPCVDAGYYTLVRPLSVGEHTIRIQGTNGSFSVDVTYNLTVAPRG